MGLFSRRKSSIQSFGSPPSYENKPFYEKPPKLHPLPGEEGFLFNFPPPTPLQDGTARTNNSMDLQPPLSRRFTKSNRPTTAHSDLSFLPPKLTPKTTKKNERPPSAASRVFFNNGQPISSTGKSVAPRSRLGRGHTISLSNDISFTNLPSSANVQSLKIKSIDLLKSNPRLKYVIPDIPPPPPSRSNELQFRHDGRGLFAAKTVSNLADELDTSGLRKLLDRDTRRYQSNYDLRKQYYRPLNMAGQIPQSRGNTVSRRNTVSTDEYENYGYPSERAYDPFPDAGPSTIRPVFGGSDRSESSNSHRFESAQSYRMPEDDSQFRAQSYRMPEDSQPRQLQPQDPIDNSRGKHNFPPILLLENRQKEEASVDQPYAISKEESPVILLASKSTKSRETQYTLPTETPIHIHSQPTASNVRPSIFAFPTEPTSSGAAIYETVEEFGSETPQDLSDLGNESVEEWHPVIPQDRKDLTLKASNQRLFDHHSSLADIHTGPSDANYSNAIEFEEEDDYHHPIFHPHTTWGESGASIASPSRTESPVFPGSRDSPVESEGSWLSGRIDIEKTVAKSFRATSRRTPPILLESSILPQDKDHSPLKIDAIDFAAEMNARAWSSANKPHYGGVENGNTSDKVSGIRERFRQVIAARRVQVVDGPNVEGIVGRISGESVERDFDRNEEIVLV